MTNLKKNLLAGVDTDIYNTLCELYNEDQKDKDIESRKDMTRDEIVMAEIEDALEHIGFKIEDAPTYKKENNDFWNDKNTSGQYWCDISSEWADNNTSIYNYTLWKHAPIIQDYITESMEELGTPEKIDLVRLFAQGECYFYERFIYELLDNLRGYIEQTDF